MNATPLFRQDGTQTDVSYCSKCGSVGTPALAETCCTKGKCSDCGGETDRYAISLCWPCREKRQMAKAEKLEDWNGPVVFNDHYYDSMDDMVDSCDGDELPEFVYVAETEHLPLLDGANILEQFCEDLYDDAYDDLNGVDEFLAAVDAFNKANKDKTYWIESTKRAARIPKDSTNNDTDATGSKRVAGENATPEGGEK